MKLKVVALSVVILFIASSFFASYGSQRPAASAQGQTTGFQIINSSWGASTAPASAAPGDRDIPLTVTLQYVFPNTATGVQGLLQLPAGFSLYNGSNTAFSSVTGTMPTGSIFQMTFQMYLASNLSLGTYILPLSISWTAAEYAYVLNQTSELTVYVAGRPQLYFAPTVSTLTSGTTNNVQLVMYNNGTGSASDILVTASSQVAGILNTIPETTSLGAGSQSPHNLEVYVPLTAAGGVVPLTISTAYKDPYGNSESASQILDMYVSAVSQPRLQFETTQLALIPGRTNNLSIKIANIGLIGVSQVSTSISTQSQSLSVLTAFPYIQTLSPNSSLSQDIAIYVSSALTNSPVSITLTATYTGQNGVAGSTSQTLGFFTSNYDVPVSNISINVIPDNTDITAGQVSNVSFLVENVGHSPAYSPVFSLSVPSPLVIVANSTYATPGAIIPSGSSVKYEAVLASSPSSAAGIYSGALSVTFSDEQGDQRTQTFSVGLKLTDSIELVIQGEQVTQSIGNLTVSGTLLNQGSASAYYASVVGNVGSSKTPGSASYIGEIDPNTPVPFSVTIPYSASNTPSNANIMLLISFKDNFGRNLTFAANTPTRLQSLSSLSQPTQSTDQSSGGQDLVMITFYGIIIVIVASAVLGIVFVRRRRSSNEEEQPQDEYREKENKVV